MDTEVDPRIPSAASAWQLWHTDTFDTDSPPFLQASGTDIVAGLYELWFHTLNEAVLENGSASFSRFHLTWGDTASARVDVYVEPFHNPSLLKLRQWVQLAYDDKSSEEEQGKAIILSIAQRHYELLQKSSRWSFSAIDWSAESKELLARIEASQGAQEL